MIVLTQTQTLIAYGNKNMKTILLSLMVLAYAPAAFSVESCPTLDSTSKYSELNKVIICLNQNIKELEGVIKAVSYSEKVPNNSNLSKGKKVNDQGVTYNLMKCSPAGREVECKFSILNSQQDRRLRFWAKRNTRAIDFDGNEYLANNTSIGNSKKYFYTEKTFVKDVPMIAKIYLPSVPDNITSFSLVELFVSDRRMQFKNISIK